MKQYVLLFGISSMALFDHLCVCTIMRNARLLVFREKYELLVLN